MKAEIIAVLSEGPAMTGEVALELGLAANKGVAARLAQLAASGLLARKPCARIGQGRGPRTTTMWSLKERGQRVRIVAVES
jgi:predicted ArsR family transcriptional regulator